MLQYS